MKQTEVCRCTDCMNCKLRIPRSSKKVICTADVFDELPLAHPYILVFRTCDFADIELDWSDDQSERR